MTGRFVSKLLLFTVFLGAPISSIQAGAILKLFRADLPGKKVIFLAEQHREIIHEIGQSVEFIAEQQKLPLFNLFNDFESHKQNITLFLECHEEMRQKLSAISAANKENRIPGNPSSALDYYYCTYVGNNAAWDQVDTVKNFDERTAQDISFAHLAEDFDDLYSKWAQCGYDEDLLATMKAQFFALEDYKVFQKYFAQSSALFNEKLMQQIKRLADLLPAADFAQLKKMIDIRTAKLPAFLLLNKQSSLINQSFFEYLFNLASANKQDLFEVLTKSSCLEQPLSYIGQLSSCYSILTDLKLLEHILTDSHPIVLVSCGLNHAESVAINFLQNCSLARSVKELDLIKDSMTNDADYCYQVMRQFINE